MPHICALCAHASILRMAPSYKLFVFKRKSEDIMLETLTVPAILTNNRVTVQGLGASPLARTIDLHRNDVYTVIFLMSHGRCVMP